MKNQEPWPNEEDWKKHYKEQRDTIFNMLQESIEDRRRRLYKNDSLVTWVEQKKVSAEKTA